MIEQNSNWTIIDIVTHTDQIKTLHLKASGERPSFVAGQYLTVKLPGFSPVEGKAYSISSAPYEETVTLTVKKIGNFSSAILEKQIGDTLLPSLPYGFFYPDREDVGELIFIAAGIGITPFVSILKQLTKVGDARPRTLLCSNQTVKEAFFVNSLALLPELNIVSCITREAVTSPHLFGRITPGLILDQVKNIETATFFLCGSIHFTKDLWQALRQIGVKSEQIYTEGFF